MSGDLSRLCGHGPRSHRCSTTPPLPLSSLSFGQFEIAACRASRFTPAPFGAIGNCDCSSGRVQSTPGTLTRTHRLAYPPSAANTRTRTPHNTPVIRSPVVVSVVRLPVSRKLP